MEQEQEISLDERESHLGKKGFWLLAVGVFLGSFLITSVVLFFNREDGNELETEQKITEKIIAADDVVEERIFYAPCQHLITEVNEDRLYVGLNAQDLEKQGWQVTAKGENSWWLYREENTLCPDDMERRNIRKNGDKLSVYTGPVGAEGEVLFDLDYSEDMLPENWQRQLEAGGIDFADEKVLFSALESLDEYLE